MLTEDQKVVIRCAYVDLNHVLKAHKLGELSDADWDAVEDTIVEMEDTFDFLTTEGYSEQG